jgi:hypothetical protein
MASSGGQSLPVSRRMGGSWFMGAMRLLRETKCRFAPGSMFSLFSDVGMIRREKFRDLLGGWVRTEDLENARIN